MPPESRTVVFGAFDRHNLGDLLFVNVVAALLPERDLVFAGIADRDLSAWGGYRVEALARLADDPRATDVIVAGGEVLTCEAWEAAVMRLPDKEANAAAEHFGRAAAVSPEKPLAAAGVAASNTLATSVFHCAQPGHCPCHLGTVAPHSVQAYWDLALAINARGPGNRCSRAPCLLPWGHKTCWPPND